MKINYEITVSTTLQEVLEVIAKELNIPNSNQWVAEKTAKSRIHNKNIYSYIIKGRESNKEIHKDSEMELGRLWVFSLNNNGQGIESWVFKTFVTFGMVKEYYIEQKSKGVNGIWLFLNEKLVKEEELEFELYELEYQPEVVDGLRTKEEIEERLLKHYINEENLEIGGRVVEFTMRVFYKGKELSYIYEKEGNCINWL